MMSARFPPLQLADLGNPALLPLKLQDVEMLAARWGGPESRRGRAWRDIEVLAEQFLIHDGSRAESGCQAWHHLLLGAGNFKRSAGMILPPALPRTPMAERPDACVIPVSVAATLPLERDDPGTWRNLTLVDGLGVPTATTLLSALWPSYHVIIDVRAFRAAVGLSASVGWAVSGLDNSDLPVRSPAEMYWQIYCEWYQPTVLRTANKLECPAVIVERALFCLDGPVVEQLKRTPWVWTDYRPTAERWMADERR
jgi:hypothetical protein